MKFSGFFEAMLMIAAVLPVIPANAQVTYGKKPNLPAPFATKSAGNGPDNSKPPQGFLPNVPAGFHINIFAADFSVPRFLTVAPNGDIFVADTRRRADRRFARSPAHGRGPATGSLRRQFESAVRDRFP
jgi:glucose/arabinose dehydrogenase